MIPSCKCKCKGVFVECQNGGRRGRESPFPHFKRKNDGKRFSTKPLTCQFIFGAPRVHNEWLYCSFRRSRSASYLFTDTHAPIIRE